MVGSEVRVTNAARCARSLSVREFLHGEERGPGLHVPRRPGSRGGIYLGDIPIRGAQRDPAPRALNSQRNLDDMATAGND